MLYGEMALVDGDYWLSIIGGAGGNTHVYRSVATDSSNNIYAAGYSYPAGGTGPDLLLVKTDPLGAVIWQRLVIGAASEVGHSVAVDSADNIYITGYSTSGASQSIDFILVKYSPVGDIIWQKLVGGNSVDISYAVTVDSENNLILAGQGFTGLGGYDYSVSKLDSDGVQIWQRVIGGNADDTLRSVAVDSQDDIYIFGYSKSPPAQNANMLLVKYSSAGEVQWGRLLGGYNFEQGNGIAIDASDDIYLVGGSASSGAGSYDMILANLNSEGSMYWQRSLGGSGIEMGEGVAIDSLGYIYTIGWTDTDTIEDVAMLIAKFDSLRNVIWQRQLTGLDSSYGNAIAIDSNDDLIIAGVTGAMNSGLSEGVLVKLPNDGSLTGVIPIAGGSLTYEATTLTSQESTLGFTISTLTVGTSSFTVTDSALTNTTASIDYDIVQL
jgi:uncharacterized delta-60 repeat protein